MITVAVLVLLYLCLKYKELNEKVKAVFGSG